MMMRKIICVTTSSLSLTVFFRGILNDLSKSYNVVAISSPGSDLEEVREREAVRTIAIPMERRISPLKDLRSLWLIWKVMRQERPDMVHSMTPKAGLLCMMASYLARVPIRIHTFTGLVWPISTGLNRRILMFTDWLTCLCATHVIPEGEGVKEDLLNHRITKKPIRVLGHGNVKGIDLDYFNPTELNIQKPQDEFSFVFVGRLVKDKGINELVSAFERIHQQYLKTKLLLVGWYENDLDPILPSTFERIEQGNGIVMYERQDDVRPFYAQADALVFPSYREGFPNVVIEAGAMGLPSIVTDINGSREIIIDGKNGVIIPSRDEEALFNAMKYFLENPDDVAAMAANARPLIASRYEQGFVRKCLYDFYKEVLDN